MTSTIGTVLNELFNSSTESAQDKVPTQRDTLWWILIIIQYVHIPFLPKLVITFKMLYLIGPDGLANWGFVNFQKNGMYNNGMITIDFRVSAPPPTKNPGSAPGYHFTEICIPLRNKVCRFHRIFWGTPS